MELATFAAGCFWGVEEKFRTLNGVQKTRVGYTGGKTENPNYFEVCSDTTGHAEAVEVEFDPTRISYSELLEIFWTNHNPTSLNFQGPDYGTQYRSAIFFHTPEQEKLAIESKEKLNNSGKYKLPVITEIVSAQTFWAAEDYHQQYLAKKGQTSCHI